MEEKKEVKLFREKNLEAAETPESLNDYLKVTSPGVWLVLAAVVTLLIGGVLWGVFGRITTTVNVAVTSGGGQTVCLVPYETIQSALARELVVTVEGKDYSLSPDAEMATVIISEETSPYVRLAGNLSLGDVAVSIPFASELAEGVYQGTLLTESLQPISLLLQ